MKSREENEINELKYNGWRNQEEFDLWKKRGLTGNIPGEKHADANRAVESSEKEIMRLLGVNNYVEYRYARKKWAKEAYGVTPLAHSDYHCSQCGARNIPFDYPNWAELLNKNVCQDCKKAAIVLSPEEQGVVELFDGQII